MNDDDISDALDNLNTATTLLVEPFLAATLRNDAAARNEAWTNIGQTVSSLSQPQVVNLFMALLQRTASTTQKLYDATRGDAA